MWKENALNGQPTLSLYQAQGIHDAGAAEVRAGNAGLLQMRGLGLRTGKALQVRAASAEI
jgi:hypothetical protein